MYLFCACSPRFRGEFRRGRKHGPGVMVSPSGAQFEGWFRDGLAHGDGILTWPDGGKFVGKYIAGKVRFRGFCCCYFVLC